MGLLEVAEEVPDGGAADRAARPLAPTPAVQRGQAGSLPGNMVYVSIILYYRYYYIRLYHKYNIMHIISFHKYMKIGLTSMKQVVWLLQ